MNLFAGLSKITFYLAAAAAIIQCVLTHWPTGS